MTRAPDDDVLPVVRAADLDDGDTLARWLVDTKNTKGERIHKWFNHVGLF